MTPEDRDKIRGNPFNDGYIITNGPSKFDLMLALFDNRPSNSEPNGRPLSFTTQSNPFRRGCKERVVTFHLSGLERNELYPEQWELWGTAHIDGGHAEETEVHIIFRTDTREGRVAILL